MCLSLKAEEFGVRKQISDRCTILTRHSRGAHSHGACSDQAGRQAKRGRGGEGRGGEGRIAALLVRGVLRVECFEHLDVDYHIDSCTR
eukprot:SAG11_NODE_23416_length_389_cov_0.472414_1_plen_87_part_01